MNVEIDGYANLTSAIKCKASCFDRIGHCRLSGRTGGADQHVDIDANSTWTQFIRDSADGFERSIDGSTWHLLVQDLVSQVIVGRFEANDGTHSTVRTQSVSHAPDGGFRDVCLA